MSVLVLADHDLGALSPATARVVHAVSELGPVDVLVVADDAAGIAQSAAMLAGVAKVLTAKGGSLADGLETLLGTLAVRYHYVVASAGSTGKDAMPRLAAKLDVMPVTDVVAIHGPNRFDRPIYAGNAVQTVTDNQPRHILTIRASAFRPAAGGNAAPVEPLDTAVVSAASLIASHRTESDTPDLATAQIVVGGGVALGSAENFQLIEQLAKKLGAAIGATRAAVDAGYAPNDWHRLEQFLRTQGVAQDEALQAGLLASNESGNVYDRFRARIMFPIRDMQGHVVGFGGRVLDDSQPKYLNSPQTPLFDKGSVLYGIDLAHSAIRESGIAIIVEGYMDVIVPHQCGATNVIACMGTALSEAHIDVLKRICTTLILALDPDDAGLRAAERGALAASESLPRQVVPVPDARGLIRYEERLGAEVRVLMLPRGMDPDELILSDRALWDRLVADALPVPEFYLQRARQEIDISTARGKQDAVERMLPVIAAVDNPVQRSHYLQRVSQWVRIDERQLMPQLDALRGTGGSPRRKRPERRISSSPADAAPAAPRAEISSFLSLEEHCISLLISDPGGASGPIRETRLSDSTFADPRHREIFRQLQPYMDDETRPYDTRALIASLDTESAAHVESLSRRLQSEPNLSEEAFREDLIKCCTRLRRQELSRRIEELRFVQLEAQEQGETDRVRDLAAQIAALTGEHLRIERRFVAATYGGKRQS